MRIRNIYIVIQIKGVHGFTQSDVLIQKIRSDHSEQRRRFTEETITFDILDLDNKEQSTNKLNGQFIHSQLFLDGLIRLKTTSNEEQEFVSFFEEHYKKYDISFEKIKSFREKYSADQALSHYTSDKRCLNNQLLNEGFRNKDIELLFVLRFFIRDIGKALEEIKCEDRVNVYRGQIMSYDEIKKLKNSIGALISINSFFSTSICPKVANMFQSGSRSNSYERVLFDIEADPRLRNVKPFANITNKSQFPEEDEVLFMPGSIFRLVNISPDNNERR